MVGDDALRRRGVRDVRGDECLREKERLNVVTCIIGLVDKGNVYVAGDSAGTNSQFTLEHRTDEKVFANGPMVMGFTTSFRMGQLLRHSLKVPDHDPKMDVSKYMVTTFVDAVRACLKAGGFQNTKEEVQKGGTFMVGYQGRLFCVYDCYQVAEVSEGYAAIGCGFNLALGSLFSTTGKPRDRIRKALRAAERFSAGVCGPFVIKMKRKA